MYSLPVKALNSPPIESTSLEMSRADGRLSVVQQAWLEPLMRKLLEMGARAVVAVPEQLCLPLHPGSVSAAFGKGELILRQSQYEGLGLALDGSPVVALQTARALAGDARATDPVCSLSPLHAQVVARAEADAGADTADLIYRRMKKGDTP